MSLKLSIINRHPTSPTIFLVLKEYVTRDVQLMPQRLNLNIHFLGTSTFFRKS